MGGRLLRVGFAVAALVLVAALAGGWLPVSADVLIGLPVLVVALPLLAGRYVGEDALVRLSGRLAAPRRRRTAMGGVSLRRAPRVLARGGRLLAVSLAERGPPAAALRA